MKRMKLNGISLLEKQGVGDVYLFLHGISSDADGFRPLMELLPNPCFAWDMAGYGQSRDLNENESLLDCLESVVNALKLDTFILAGSSLGGLLAGLYAHKNPKKLKELVLISPASGYNQPKNAPLLEGIQTRLDTLKLEGAEKFALTRASNIVYQQAKLPAIQRAMRGLRVQGLSDASRLLNEGDLLQKAPEITVKTHIICGIQDKITPLEKIAELAKAFDPALITMTCITEAGHGVYQEKPQEVAKALIQRLI